MILLKKISVNLLPTWSQKLLRDITDAGLTWKKLRPGIFSEVLCNSASWWPVQHSTSIPSSEALTHFHGHTHTHTHTHTLTLTSETRMTASILTSWVMPTFFQTLHKKTTQLNRKQISDLAFRLIFHCFSPFNSYSSVVLLNLLCV